MCTIAKQWKIHILQEKDQKGGILFTSTTAYRYALHWVGTLLKKIYFNHIHILKVMLCHGVCAVLYGNFNILKIMEGD